MWGMKNFESGWGKKTIPEIISCNLGGGKVLRGKLKKKGGDTFPLPLHS
jgi:hypothetical protein